MGFAANIIKVNWWYIPNNSENWDIGLKILPMLTVSGLDDG